MPRYVALAGIRRHLTPHDLRHSSLSEFSELDTPLEVVRELAGHESVKTTELYVHRAKHHERAAVDRLDRAWREAERTRPNTKKPLVERPDTARNADYPKNTGVPTTPPAGGTPLGV